MILRLLLFLPLLIETSPLRAASFTVPPALVEQRNRIEAAGGQSARVRAFDELVDRLGRLSFKPLDGAVRESGIDEVRISRMRIESRGLISVEEFLRRRDVEGGYSLGLSLARGEYPMLSERMGLRAWPQAYAEFGIDWRREKNHTEIFMGKIRASERPIVMLVPRGLFEHPESVTTKEFLWFFQPADRMRTTTFVFGAYDVLTPEMEELRKSAGLSKDALRALVMRALGHGPSSWEQGL